MSETHEFTTDANNVAEIITKTNAFNQKARQLGLNVEIFPEISEPREVVEKDEITGEVIRTSYVVDVVLPDVTIALPGGWKFVAVIEHLGEDGNMVNKTPFAAEIETPAEYRTADPTCDHCGLHRLRNTTIVVQNEEGDFTRVGSTCAKSYLGIPSSKLIVLFHYLDDIRQMPERGGSSGEIAYGVTSFLARVAIVTKLYGWVSKGVAWEYGKTATAQIAWTWMNGRPTEYFKKDYPELFDTITDEVWEDADAKAEAAVEWLTDEVDPEGNDYLWNLSVAVRSGAVTGKRSGIVASLLTAWEKEMGYRAEKAARESRPASVHYGDVKSRYTLADLEMVYKRYNESHFGTNVFAILVAQSGEVFWLRTGIDSKFGDVLDLAKTGDKFVLKATVKEHKFDKNDKPVTVLTRPALV